MTKEQVEHREHELFLEDINDEIVTQTNSIWRRKAEINRELERVKLSIDKFGYNNDAPMQKDSFGSSYTTASSIVKKLMELLNELDLCDEKLKLIDAAKKHIFVDGSSKILKG